MTLRVSTTDTVFRGFSGMQATGTETRLDGWLPCSAGGLEAALEMLRASARSLPCFPVLILNSDCHFQPERQTRKAALLGKGRGPTLPASVASPFQGRPSTLHHPFCITGLTFLGTFPHPITPCCLEDRGQNYLQKSHLWISHHCFYQKTIRAFVFVFWSDRF